MANQFKYYPSPNVPVGRYYPPGWTAYSPTITTTGGATSLTFTSSSFIYSYNGSVLIITATLTSVSATGSTGAPLLIPFPTGFTVVAGVPATGQNVGSAFHFKNGTGNYGGSVLYYSTNNMEFQVNDITGTLLLDSSLGSGDNLSFTANIPVIAN